MVSIPPLEPFLPARFSYMQVLVSGYRAAFEELKPEAVDSVYVPLHLFNLDHAETIDYRGEDLPQATILRGTQSSWVGVPERFRAYWRELAAEVGGEEAFVPSSTHTFADWHLQGGLWQTNDSYLDSVQSHSRGGEPPQEPEWIGTWPETMAEKIAGSGYTYSTIPQLIDALNLLTGGGGNIEASGSYSASRGNSAIAFWDSDHWYCEYTSAETLTIGESWVTLARTLTNDTDSPINVPVSIAANQVLGITPTLKINGMITSFRSVSVPAHDSTLVTCEARIPISTLFPSFDQDYALFYLPYNDGNLPDEIMSAPNPFPVPSGTIPENLMLTCTAQAVTTSGVLRFN